MFIFCFKDLLLQGSLFCLLQKVLLILKTLIDFYNGSHTSLSFKCFYYHFFLLYISNVKKKEYYCSNVKLELTAKAIKTLYPQIFCILIGSQKILSKVRVMPFISAVNFGVRLTEIDINLKRQRNHHIEMNSFYSLLSSWSQ